MSMNISSLYRQLLRVHTKGVILNFGGAIMMAVAPHVLINPNNDVHGSRCPGNRL